MAMELKYEWDKINEFNVEKPLCEIYTIFFKRIKTHTKNKKISSLGQIKYRKSNTEKFHY
jgi:hypothetical protein